MLYDYSVKPSPKPRAAGKKMLVTSFIADIFARNEYSDSRWADAKQELLSAFCEFHAQKRKDTFENWMKSLELFVDSHYPHSSGPKQ